MAPIKLLFRKGVWWLLLRSNTHVDYFEFRVELISYHSLSEWVNRFRFALSCYKSSKVDAPSSKPLRISARIWEQSPSRSQPQSYGLAVPWWQNVYPEHQPSRCTKCHAAASKRLLSQSAALNYIRDDRSTIATGNPDIRWTLWILPSREVWRYWWLFVYCGFVSRKNHVSYLNSQLATCLVACQLPRRMCMLGYLFNTWRLSTTINCWFWLGSVEMFAWLLCRSILKTVPLPLLMFMNLSLEFTNKYITFPTPITLSNFLHYCIRFDFRFPTFSQQVKLCCWWWFLLRHAHATEWSLIIRR